MLAAFCLLTVMAECQKIEKFFDYNWHECEAADASFYSVAVKTDSGWYRKDFFAHSGSPQMAGTCEDSAGKIENGIFYYFFPDKKLNRTGYYKHGKKQGLWLSYHSNGMMSDSTFYQDGNNVGVSMGWYPDGNPKDSENITSDGSGMGIYWFNNGQPSAAGRFKNWKPNGKWQYFHPNGKTSSLEMYEEGNLTSIQYYDENGAAVDTAGKNHGAEFPGGAEAWQKYLYKHLYFPDEYKITNADKAVCVIRFTVDIDGKVVDAYVHTPFFDKFDNIALEVVKRSPLWTPAVQHNRKVPFYQSQAVFFAQNQ